MASIPHHARESKGFPKKFYISWGRMGRKYSGGSEGGVRGEWDTGGVNFVGESCIYALESPINGCYNWFKTNAFWSKNDKKPSFLRKVRGMKRRSGVKGMKRAISLFLALTLALSLAVPASAAEEGYSDVGSHYAKGAVETWSGYGVLQGYPDGTFRPDEPVTRAEMATVLDRVMGYQNTVENTYTDVPQRAWYTQSILHLAAEGIFQGRKEGQMLPKANITRQEAFATLARAMGMEAGGEAPGFADDADIAKWAVGSLAAMKEAGYIKGDKKGNIRPDDPITRAEVVTVLNNMAAAFVHEDGEYSADCAGNLIINAQDVHLKDMTIEGDLIVADGVGEGDVYIEKVTVKGDIILRGCGENSFHILPGCDVKNIIVTKTTTGRIRLVNESGETIPMVWVNDAKAGVILDGGSFDEIVVTCDASVTVAAKKVTTLSVTGGATLTVAKGSTVSSLELTATAKDAEVTVEGKVTELINDAGIKIYNKGTVASKPGNAGGGSVPEYYPSNSGKKETLSEVKLQLLAPRFGEIPDTADVLGVGYSAKTEWFNADGSAPSYRWKEDSEEEDTFTADQAYQAVVTLTPASGYVFGDDMKVSVTDGNGNDFTPAKSEKSGNNWIVTLLYEKTEEKDYIEYLSMSGVQVIDLNKTGILQAVCVNNHLVDPSAFVYQWYECSDAKGAGKTPIPGANGETYTVPTTKTSVEGSLYYTVSVTFGGKTYDSIVTMTVKVEKMLDESTIPVPVIGDITQVTGLTLPKWDKSSTSSGDGLIIRFALDQDSLLEDPRLGYQVDIRAVVECTETGKETVIYQEAKVDDRTDVYVGKEGVRDIVCKIKYFTLYDILFGKTDDTFAYRIHGLNQKNEAADEKNTVDFVIKELKMTVTPNVSGTNHHLVKDKAGEKIFDLSASPIRLHMVGQLAQAEGDAAAGKPQEGLKATMTEREKYPSDPVQYLDVFLTDADGKGVISNLSDVQEGFYYDIEGKNKYMEEVFGKMYEKVDWGPYSWSIWKGVTSWSDLEKEGTALGSPEMVSYELYFAYWPSNRENKSEIEAGGLDIYLYSRPQEVTFADNPNG